MGNGNGDYKIGYKKPPKGRPFEKGRSGNPGGLPKGTPKVSVAVMRLLALSPDEPFKPASRGEAIALALIEKAIAGDLAAIREVLDRTEGRPKEQPAEPMTEAEMAKVLLRMLMESGKGKTEAVALLVGVGVDERDLLSGVN